MIPGAIYDGQSDIHSQQLENGGFSHNDAERNLSSKSDNGSLFESWGERMKKLWGTIGSVRSPGSVGSVGSVGSYGNSTTAYGSDLDIDYGTGYHRRYDNFYDSDDCAGAGGDGPGDEYGYNYHNSDYFHNGRHYSSKSHYDELQELLSKGDEKAKGTMAIVPYDGNGVSTIGSAPIQAPSGPFGLDGQALGPTGHFSTNNGFGRSSLGPRFKTWYNSRKSDAKQSTCYRCQSQVWSISSEGWCNKCSERMRLKQEV